MNVPGGLRIQCDWPGCFSLVEDLHVVQVYAQLRAEGWRRIEGTDLDFCAHHDVVVVPR